MWYVITDGPMKILKVNTAAATTEGAPQMVENHRSEWTGKDQTKENKLTVAIQKFDNAKMKPGETLSEFDERFSSIIIEFTSLGKDYSNREIALKVMRALPREWDVKTIAMRESKDLNKLELHDLFADLKAYEFELGIRTEEDPSTSQQTKELPATIVILPVEESSSKKSVEQLSNEAMSLFVKKFSKFMRKNQSQMNKPHFNKDHTDDGQACFNCGKKGHFIAECNMPKKDEKKSKSEKSISEESSSESEDEKVECLMAKEDQDSTDEMIFDFNSVEFTREDLVTSLHDMVDEFKRLSHQFNEATTEKQKLENKLALSSCSQQKEVNGLRVKLSLLMAENDDLRRLFHVTLKENKRLINTVNTWNKSSVSKKRNLEESIWFLDSGCSRHMTGNKDLLSEIVDCKGPTITFGDNSKGKAVGKGVVLVIPLSVPYPEIAYCDEKNALLPPPSPVPLPGEPVTPPEAPPVPQPVVIPQLDHPKSGTSSYGLVWTNTHHKPRGKEIYSHQTADQLIKLPKRLRNEKSEAIDRIRSDRGTEFLNQFLSSYFEDHGIKHELSAARSPQQNGVAERRSCTLKEAARTMLAESGISQKFWAEAVNTACYTQNRSLINKNHEKTPYEIWTGKQPDIGYFRIFGCKCSIHNNGKTHLTAFDVKADNGIFLGYSSVSKAYRAYNQRTLTVEESIHIVFDESSICHDNNNNSIHDFINNFDATNLKTSSEDDVDLRKPGGSISKENPTAQEQTQQVNKPEDNQQPQNVQNEEGALEQEEEIIQPTELNPYGPFLQ
ncbi:uncharacterized protein [Primulina eburnea]|uniref:uncharacterized protein n=1 Tax=Primulina eburnea TaxID=1245227 RepID=UPI003C6C91BB